MIELTDVAAEKIKSIQAADGMAKDLFLRVGIVGGGCSGFQFTLDFGSAQDDDLRFEIKSIQVAIDPMSAMYLDGTTVDYIETLQGAGFKFHSDNVKSSCGCGNSVSF